MPQAAISALTGPQTADTGDSIAVESMACHLCGHKEAHLVVRAPDFEYACKPGQFNLVRCSSCDHVYAQPMPAARDMLGLYPPTYYTINPDSPLYLHGFVYRAKIRRDVDRLMTMLTPRPPQSVLDIGCGDAARLIELAKRGLQTIDLVGMDLMFEDRIRDRADQAGVHLIQGNIESDLKALEDRRYEFVIMSQLIEHLRRPKDALLRLRAKLVSGAQLLIETPQLGGGMDYRLFNKRYWGGYHIPRHLHLFSRRSLAATLRQCGYHVIDQGNLPSPGFWIISLRNWLGLSSARRGRSIFEILHFANPAVVGAFTAVDLLRVTLGQSTSNQYLLAQVP